ncbi:hypothetical protein EJB05_16651, partial [Eragrostis curvula]
MVGDIRDAPGSENDPDVINITRFAVSEHNDAANALEFEKVVKVREQAVHGTVYYLTIEAKDGEAKKLYEAEVYDDWDSKRLHNFWPAEHKKFEFATESASEPIRQQATAHISNGTHPPVQLLLVEVRRGDGLPWRGHERDEPGRLHHVHVLRPGPVRQRPPEVMHHVADHGRHKVDPELRAGAHPPSHAERQHAEVGALDVDVLLEKALWPELEVKATTAVTF